MSSVSFDESIKYLGESGYGNECISEEWTIILVRNAVRPSGVGKALIVAEYR